MKKLMQKTKHETVTGSLEAYLGPCQAAMSSLIAANYFHDKVRSNIFDRSINRTSGSSVQMDLGVDLRSSGS